MKLIRFEDKTKIKLFRGNDLGHYDRSVWFYVRIAVEKNELLQRTRRNTDASTANDNIVKSNVMQGDSNTHDLQ